VTFVEIVGRTKTGKPSRKTHRLDWGICDACGEGIWSSRIKATGLTCRMTPRCPGKHRKEQREAR
jgi:RNA polymerase-binding transcription factor DksA